MRQPLYFQRTVSMLQKIVNQLLSEQLQEWDLAKNNYQGLQNALKKTFVFEYGVRVDIQYNPARIQSSTARVDSGSINERKCFLCQQNRPSQQRMQDFGEDYTILVNPFPIFPKHLTIVHKNHVDQLIEGRMTHMLHLASELPDFVIFYNGPRSGASAPDHFHFQAGNKGFMPAEYDIDSLTTTLIRQEKASRVYTINRFLRQCIVFEGNDAGLLCRWFNEFTGLIKSESQSQEEPQMNILAVWENGQWRVLLFPRRQHRPRQFFEEGHEKILISPGSVDFGGVFVIPREEDYLKITPEDVEDIFSQLSLTQEEFNALISRYIQA
jgi:hypothetical protein